MDTGSSREDGVVCGQLRLPARPARRPGGLTAPSDQAKVMIEADLAHAAGLQMLDRLLGRAGSSPPARAGPEMVEPDLHATRGSPFDECSAGLRSRCTSFFRPSGM